MVQKVFLLADCSNFYASCERLFRPDLKGIPVVVLSNNDGCIVARSAEAKALGFKMGEPYFECREKIERNGVAVFSSNYALYADISNRVMTTIEHLSAQVERYSIDECFVDTSGIQDQLGFGFQIRNTVQQWTGITVGVGIAQTKTLAKLANHAAKKYPATGGVVDLTDRTRQLKLMQLVPVEDIWGVGQRISARLHSMGIHTAFELAHADQKHLRQQFSVVLERTIEELNGKSCIELEESAPASKQIIRSRSFGTRITELAQMRQAICEFTAKAGEKLREESLSAKRVSVFIRTNAFNPSEPQYSQQASTSLITPTSDTRDLVATAMQLLEIIWKNGYRYSKGGIMLDDFNSEAATQGDLFAQPSVQRNPALMKVIDEINRSGKGRVFLAGQGIRQDWAMQRRFLSPAYTTRWSDLPTVR